jgi:Uma2 family endonuclease
MVQTRPRFLSFEEYLSHDDGSGLLYELFNGELIPVPPESGENVEIAGALFLAFAALLGRKRVRGHGLELEVRGEPKNRYPDLTILREEHIDLLKPRNTIRLTMPPPLLVVEVVSPGAIQRDRDYIAKRPLAGISKRSQYQDLGINEYWIVNPQDQEITVLIMTETGYQEVGVFRGDEAIVSPAFPALVLQSKELFA